MTDTAVLSFPHTLENPDLYDHPVQGFQVVETHISWVILTGLFAYKIKKPVNLSFLDFSTLEKRYFYCQEEVRVNRRLCPNLYLGVVALTGDPNHPVLNGRGRVFEFMVKMKQFDEELLWDRLLLRKELTAEWLDLLAARVAAFHGKAAVAPPTSSFGRPETFWRSVDATLSHVIPSLHGKREQELFEHVTQWMQREFAEKAERMKERLAAGFVREGHGDLHLRNIALFSHIQPDIQIFDAIEFDENLRWIDVMNDAAFLIMDLEHRGRPDLAWRFLNTYLEKTGDYEGLDLFRLYAANRAMVRAKVLAIQTAQEVNRKERVALHAETRHFLRTAEAHARASVPCLYITRGLSGSGKTTGTKTLAEAIGAIRLRSDIERKRLYGLPPEAASSEELKRQMYGPEGNARTYTRLKDLADKLLKTDYSVIVDATFLKQKARSDFHDLAMHAQAGFRILDFRASAEELRRRVGLRMRDKKDASEADLAILEEQILHQEDLTDEELPFVIGVGS